MTPPGNKSFTRPGRFFTLRKLFTKRRDRPSLPTQYSQEKSENNAINNIPLTQEKSENSAISNIPLTKSTLNQDPEPRILVQIEKDANLTSRTIESVLLVSEELDALTLHRQALDSLAAKLKDALVKVPKGKATSDHQVLTTKDVETAKDEQIFSHVLEPITDAEQYALNLTCQLFSLICRTVGLNGMTDAERDRKEETRNLARFLLRLGFDRKFRSSTSNAQKQLFEKVAKLCTQYVNECKPDAKDAVSKSITPKNGIEDAAPPEDTAKDDVPKDDAPKDDAPNHDAPKDDAPLNDTPDGDALDQDVLYHNAPKQVGEHILVVAGRLKLLELELHTPDAFGNNIQKQILAEIVKLCSDFLDSDNDRGNAEMDDANLAVEEVRCLARSINARVGHILAKIAMEPVNQRRELIQLVDLNLNRWMDECRKDVKRVVDDEKPAGSPQSSKEIGTQTYES